MSVMMMTMIKDQIAVMATGFTLREGVEKGLTQLLRAWPSPQDVAVSISINDLKSFFRLLSFPWCLKLLFDAALVEREGGKMSTPVGLRFISQMTVSSYRLFTLTFDSTWSQNPFLSLLFCSSSIFIQTHENSGIISTC